MSTDPTIIDPATTDPAATSPGTSELPSGNAAAITTPPDPNPVYDPSQPVVPASGTPAGSSFIDPKLATVEGRISGIVDGEIGDIARTNAKLQYHKSGLMNTGHAIGQGELAALKAAESIATKDAALYGQAALADQQQKQTLESMAVNQGYNLETMSVQQRNDLEKMAQTHTNNLDTLRTQFGYDTRKMDKQQSHALETLTTQHGFNMEQLMEQLDFNRESLDANLSADERQMMTQTFGQMFGGMLNNIGHIMADPQLPGASKRKSVNEIYDYFQDWATSLSDLNSYEIDWSGA